MTLRPLRAFGVVPPALVLALVLAPGGSRLEARDFVRGNANGDATVDVPKGRAIGCTLCHGLPD